MKDFLRLLSISNRLRKMNGINKSLPYIRLKLKGYNSSCEDILETTEVTGSKWDRILMNPPFENGQDMQHIKHCYDTFLKEDGILVAIASSGTMSNSTKKYLEFREWLSNKNAVIINNGQAFKEAFNSTGTATVMIKLVK